MNHAVEFESYLRRKVSQDNAFELPEIGDDTIMTIHTGSEDMYHTLLHSSMRSGEVISLYAVYRNHLQQQTCVTIKGTDKNGEQRDSRR